MSSSPEHQVSSPKAAPRVGILRGMATSTQPVRTEVHPHLPAGVRDMAALEAEQQRAMAAGYAEGYEAGLASGRDEVLSQSREFNDGCKRAVHALEQAAAQLVSREASGLEAVADQAAELALRIAEIVLQREIAVAVNPGRDAIARTIHLAPETGQIRVRLNPEDHRRLGHVEDITPGRTMELVADATIASGGCVISVGATRIDAQIPSALARIQEVLR